MLTRANKASPQVKLSVITILIKDFNNMYEANVVDISIVKLLKKASTIEISKEDLKEWSTAFQNLSVYIYIYINYFSFCFTNFQFKNKN